MPILNNLTVSGGEETIYGINAKGWAGDPIDKYHNGIYLPRTDQAVGTLNLGVLNNAAFLTDWNYKFEGSSGLVGIVDFSNLMQVPSMALTFVGTNVTGFDARRANSVLSLSQVFEGVSSFTTLRLDSVDTLYSGTISAAFKGTSVGEARFCSLRVVYCGVYEEMQSLEFGILTQSFHSVSNCNVYFNALTHYSFSYDEGWINTAIEEGWEETYDDPAILYELENMFSGGTGNVVHFNTQIRDWLVGVYGTEADAASALAASIDSTGGTTVVFDLPTYYYLRDGQYASYYRKNIYDTATSLAWKKQGYDPEQIYWTSGTSLPSAGDTMYSDSACTRAYKTIADVIDPDDGYVTPEPSGGGGDEEEGGEEEPEE